MPRATILNPPLPPQLPGRAWLVIAARHGIYVPQECCSMFYYYADVFPLPNVPHAVLTAQDWIIGMRVPVGITYNFQYRWQITNAWVWDGTVLHTGVSNQNANGTLPSGNIMKEWPVCFTKRAIEAGKFVVGRSYSGSVARVWATSDFTLSNLGLVHFKGYASVVYGDFTSEGNLWHSAVYTAHTSQQLLPIVDIEVLTPLCHLRRRRRSISQVAPGGFNLPFPTIIG